MAFVVTSMEPSMRTSVSLRQVWRVALNLARQLPYNLKRCNDNLHIYRVIYRDSFKVPTSGTSMEFKFKSISIGNEPSFKFNIFMTSS